MLTWQAAVILGVAVRARREAAQADAERLEEEL